MSTAVKTQNSFLNPEHWRVAGIGLFHLLVLLVPFLFTWINDELFEFNKMIAVYALTGLIVSTWVGRMLLQQRFIWRKTPLDWVLAAFAASQVLSTVLSIHPYTSVWGYYSRFHGGLASTVAYLLLYYTAVNTFTRRSLQGLWWSVIVGAIGASLYAAPEHFGHSPSCWLITNGQSFGVDCWIQDVKSRVFGTFGQPNWLAAYLIMIIPLTISMWSRQWAKTSHWTLAQKLGWATVGCSVVGLFTATTLYTRSRSGILGLGLGLGVYIGGWIGWQLWHRLRGHSPHSSWKPLSIFVGAAMAIIVSVSLYSGTPFSPSLQSLLSNSTLSVAPSPATPAETGSVDRLGEGGTDSGEIRKIVWQGAIKVWQRYPIFGSGVETFAYSYYQDRPVEHNNVSEWDFLYNKAHNEFLNYLATTGLIGLVTYLAVLGMGGWLGFKQIFTAKPDENASVLQILAWGSGVIALSVSNFFGFSTVMVTVLLYLYMAGLSLLAIPDTKYQATQSDDWHPAQTIGLILLALCLIWWLWLVRTQWQADYRYAQGKNAIKSGLVELGIQNLEMAVRLSPAEALFYDELAGTYGQISAALELQHESTAAAQFATSAEAFSDEALRRNPRHLNFYKTRARLFITLGSFDASKIPAAQHVLEQALKLSPTDAKLVYNLALVVLSQGQTAKGQELLETAIQLRPNYESARAELGKLFEQQKNWTEAMAEYQYILTKNPKNDAIRDRLEQLQATLSAQPQTR